MRRYHNGPAKKMLTIDSIIGLSQSAWCEAKKLTGNKKRTTYMYKNSKNLAFHIQAEKPGIIGNKSGAEGIMVRRCFREINDLDSFLVWQSGNN